MNTDTNRPDEVKNTEAPSVSLSAEELRAILAESKRNASSSTWLPSAVTAVLVSLLFTGYIVFIHPSPNSNPSDDHTIIQPAQLVEKSMNDWMAELQTTFEKASADASGHRWKNDAEFGAEFEVVLTEIRERNFAPINQMIQSNLSGEQWSSDRASALFQEMANGFGRASK